MADLKGVSVVVTRAAHQADELCSLIEAAGGRPVRFPVTRIESVAESDPDIRAVAPHLGRMDIVIFISPNAATFGLALFQKLGLTLHKDATVIAIGPGTARVLEACGLAVNGVPESRFDSEALLGLPELQNVASKQILIVRGLGGRDEIARVLSERGGQVWHMPCYKRLAVQDVDSGVLDAWSDEGYHALILTSTSAYDHLNKLLGVHMGRLTQNLKWVVSSSRIARHCRDNGFTGELVVAQNAGMPALVQALKA